MKILTPGHRYELENFEDKQAQGQILQFIDKVPLEDEPSRLITRFDGTTNEEVLEVLIDRLKFLNNKFPCLENKTAIMELERALFWLNERTKNRIERNVEGRNKV